VSKRLPRLAMDDEHGRDLVVEEDAWRASEPMDRHVAMAVLFRTISLGEVALVRGDGVLRKDAREEEVSFRGRRETNWIGRRMTDLMRRDDFPHQAMIVCRDDLYKVLEHEVCFESQKEARGRPGQTSEGVAGDAAKKGRKNSLDSSV
jgi:hypothetical protein